MYTPDKKKQKSFKDTSKKKKKKGKPVEAPKLPMFPALPEKNYFRKKKAKVLYKELNFGENTGMEYAEKPYSKAPFIRGGSIRSVLCGERFPLPPRPQPHGGVYGNPKCPECRSRGGLLKTVFGTLHKKMRKLLTTEFDKAKFIIEYMITKAQQASDIYRQHIQALIDEFGPLIDAADDTDWDDHVEVRDLLQKYRDMQKEVERLKLELKKLRENREAEIQKAIEEKRRELEEAERRFRDLERELAEAIANLEDWRLNHEKKLQDPADEILRQLARLQEVRDSILLERDSLRHLLAWETKIATDQIVKEMEQIIAADVQYVLSFVHPAWYRLVLENQKLMKEEYTLNAENHLLELEVETLQRQVGQLESQKKRLEQTNIHGIRPPHLKALVDRHVRIRGNVQLYDYPTTLELHE